jgi:hypothetical protein
LTAVADEAPDAAPQPAWVGTRVHALVNHVAAILLARPPAVRGH